MSHLLQERTVLARLPRDEIEDRYYRLQEDNLSLKKQINTKDDKLKKYEFTLILHFNFMEIITCTTFFHRSMTNKRRQSNKITYRLASKMVRVMSEHPQGAKGKANEALLIDQINCNYRRVND